MYPNCKTVKKEKETMAFLTMHPDVCIQEERKYTNKNWHEANLLESLFSQKPLSGYNN